MANSFQFAQYPSLRGKRLLITGGATGIGESLVRHFAEQGSRIAFFDIQDDAASQLVQSIEAAGRAAPTYLRCDVTDVQVVQTATANAIQELEGLDVVINNAGNDQRHPTAEVTAELWDKLMAVNLRHQFFVTQAALPALRESAAAQRSPSILNLSSIAWIIPNTGMPVYVTAKAAIVGLTRTLAHELGPDNIRVNAILPGAIVTEKQRRFVLTPEYTALVLANQALKRHLQPDEVSRLALFLASEDASAITGQSHIIDGGWV